MPTQRELQISQYLAVQERASDSLPVATGETAEIFDRIVQNNLERVDRLENVTIDALYDGANFLKMIVTTEFILPALGSEAVIRTYRVEKEFGGETPPVTESDAFLRAVADIENQIVSDPPYLYIDNGLEEIRRQQLAERNARNSRGEIEGRTRIQGMTARQVVEILIGIREDAIRANPFTSDGIQQPTGDLLFGDSISPNRGVLNARLLAEMEAIRESLGEVVVHRVIFDSSLDGELKTKIAYNFEPRELDQEGPRYIIGPQVPENLKNRYQNLTAILYDGDLPPSDGSESIESLRARLRQSETRLSEYEFFEAANRLLLEAENIRGMALEIIGVEEQEIDFDVVNQNYDFLKAEANEIFDLIDAPGAAAYCISNIRDIALIDPEWDTRISSLRSFVSRVKNFIFEIDSQIVDAEIEARRQLQETLNSDEKDKILDARSFIIVDSKNRSLEFILPLEEGDKSIQVLAIKKYLGMPLSSGDLFDGETREELESFQDLNTNTFQELVRTDLGREFGATGELSVWDQVPEAYGRIGPFTFLMMKNLGGLERAVEETLDFTRRLPAQATGTDESSIKTLSKVAARDGIRSPWQDANYYYFMYVTEETRDTVNSDIPGSYERMVRQNSEIALRKGVEELFEYHARSKTWVVEGKNNDHKVFNRLLKFQNKIESEMDKDQSFTLTIEPQTLAENLGVSDRPRVDVLFGQSLAYGAKPLFAAIDEIHSPTERPKSKFKFTIKIRKDMMDVIPTDPSRTVTIGKAIAEARRVSNAIRDAINNRDALGEAALRGQAQVERAILDKTNEFNNGLKWAKNNKKEAIEKGVKGAFGLAKKFSRDAERARQFGSTTIASELSKKQEEALLAQVKAMDNNSGGESPTKSYTLYKFNQMIDDVAKMFDQFDQRLGEFGREGGRIRPVINLREEAKHLREVKSALTSFLSANGIVKRDFLRQDTRIEISFVATIAEREFKQRPVTTFAPPATLTEERRLIEEEQPPIIVKDRSGYLPVSINYKLPNRRSRRLQQATLVLAQKYPWNLPRTMNYLVNLHELLSEANNYDKSCLTTTGPDFSERDPIDIIKKYTTPSLIILPGPEIPSGIRTEKAEKKLNDIYPSIKTSQQKLKEDLSLEGDGPIARAFREDLIRIEQSRTYPIVPEIPTVELCTLESLFEEFLDKFDLKTLFCNYAACIPDLPWPPSFSWDLDFTIPEIPRIPSFDPMAIIIPKLELAIVDLILGFLCGLVRGILDLIRFPDCEDLANFGQAAWDQLWDNSRGPSKRLLVMQDAAKVMEDLDIPSEAYPDVSKLFDELALILTPAELCSLLDGSADGETLSIVLQLIRRTYLELEKYFRNEADISMFFMLLGRFVDPELCNRIANTSNIILGDVFCPERPATSLRRRLQENRATAEEIAKALSEATKRREAFSDFFSKDPLEDLIPSAGNGIPGPYDNDVSLSLAKMSTEGALNVVEVSMKNDLASFVPSLLDNEQSQKGPGDPGFNPLEQAEYVFIRTQLERLASYFKSKTQRDLNEIEALDFQSASDSIDDGQQGVIFQNLGETAGGRDEDILDALEQAAGRTNRFNLSFFRESVLKGSLNFENVAIRINQDKSASIIDYTNPEEPVVQTIAAAEGEINEEGIRNYLLQILNIRSSNRFKIQKPGQYRDNGDGTYEVFGQLVDEDGDGQRETPVNFDMESPQDIKQIIDIMSFPLRNVKDEAKVAKFLEQTLNQAKSVQNVEKKFDAAWAFYDEEVRYLSPEELNARPDYAKRSSPLRANPPEDRNLEINLLIENKEESEDAPPPLSITYQEIPVLEELKDCYNVYFPGRIFSLDGSSSRLWRGKTYNYELSEDMADIRNQARDIAEPGYRLLRPAAFAELFLNSWSSVQAGNQQEVTGYGTNLWNKLQGNTTDPGENEKVRGEYERVVENILDSLAGEIANSRFFDLDGIKALATDLTAEFKLSKDGSCYIENEPFIDFEKLREDILEAYQDSLSQEEYNPANRDFSKPGPLEDSLTGQMVFLYVKTFLIEFMLRGLFVFSKYRPGKMFESEVIKDYLNLYMLASLENSVARDPAGDFASEIKKVGNDSDLSTALKNMIESVTEDVDFIDSIESKFRPEFGSFKEQFFIDLVSGRRDVQSYKNILPPSTELRQEFGQSATISGPQPNSRRGFVPMHSSFSGPIASNREGITRLRNGHFFLEKYFRMDEGVFARYFSAEDSLVRRLIERVKNANRNEALSGETFYDVNQYSGVFSRLEMDILIKELSLASAPRRPGRAQRRGRVQEFRELEQLAREVNQLIEELSQPGNLKMGMRVVYIPQTSGAGQIIGGEEAQFEEFPVGSGNFIETGEVVFNTAPANDRDKRITDSDILQQEISQTIGVDYENQQLFGRDLPDIPEVPITTKFRAYVADTNPKLEGDFGYNVPVKEDGRLIVQEGLGPVWTSAPREITEYRELFRIQLAVGVPFLNVETAPADGVRREDAPPPENDRAPSPPAISQTYPGTPQNIIFPTPLVNRELDICARDIVAAHKESDASMGNLLVRTEDHLIEQMFGLVKEGRRRERKLRSEPGSEIKYLFDFVLPLDRYQSLFLIQNQILMDQSDDLSSLMDPTRDLLTSLVNQLKDTTKLNSRLRFDGRGAYSILVSDQASGGPGPMAKYKLGGFGPAIEKLAKRTIPTLIRGQAAFLDPAYKDIKDIFDNDPCKTRSGLTTGTLSTGLALVDENGNYKLDSGFDENKSYNPFNTQGALDLSILMNLIAYSGPIGALAYMPQLLNVIEHLSNSITSSTEKKRYGKFLSPIGLLALAMPEMPGEIHRNKVREARCDEDGNRTTPQDFVLCDDVNQEEEQ